LTLLAITLGLFTIYNLLFKNTTDIGCRDRPYLQRIIFEKHTKAIGNLSHHKGSRPSLFLGTLTSGFDRHKMSLFFLLGILTGGFGG
jgi:hypothetical protein